MSVVSQRALAVLLIGAAESGEMVFVHTVDNLGFEFGGRVLTVDGDTFDIEASDGEVVYHLRVARIKTVDVIPFQRFTGYSAQNFVSDFGPEVS